MSTEGSSSTGSTHPNGIFFRIDPSHLSEKGVEKLLDIIADQLRRGIIETHDLRYRLQKMTNQMVNLQKKVTQLKSDKKELEEITQIQHRTIHDLHDKNSQLHHQNTSLQREVKQLKRRSKTGKRNSNTRPKSATENSENDPRKVFLFSPISSTDLLVSDSGE